MSASEAISFHGWAQKRHLHEFIWGECFFGVIEAGCCVIFVEKHGVIGGDRYLSAGEYDVFIHILSLPD